MAVMRILGYSNDVPSVHDGRYLKHYDPEREGHGPYGLSAGVAYIETTDDPAQAMVFPDAGAALRFWRQESTLVPRRPHDGAPNRPLCAFTVEVV